MENTPDGSECGGKATPVKRALPPIALFVIAPLVAEFLPGNLPISMSGALIVLAPMYGGGALLVREMARRSRIGWFGIFVLALAYGVLEEGLIMCRAFSTQTFSG
jgi:hypothetical protein